MPNDLFRWEEGGALVHHCPKCFTPLTHARCQKRCLGKHVEWCSRYHCQLFKIGCSTSCMACNNSDVEHDKRHREIAGLLRQLKQFRTESTPSTPVAASPKTPTFARIQAGNSESPLSKKEHKAAKRAAKAADRPRVITNQDVQQIAVVLHPEQSKKAEEEERALLDDPEIKLNMSFHPGTSNNREERHRFLKLDKAGGGSLEIEKEEMNGLTDALLVPRLELAKTAAERKLVLSVREAIRQDLVHVHGEDQQTMMRKAGFWRWASRKAYNRLVQAGRMWDWKSGECLNVENDEGVIEAIHDTDEVSAGQEDDERDAPRQDAASSSSESRNTSISSASRASTGRTSIDTSAEVDDWTTVSRVSKVTKQVEGTLKLSSNGGLAHLRAKAK